jgi:hypothetical protein
MTINGASFLAGDETARLQVRRGTAAELTAANPTLSDGEFGFETDTGYLKIGDGATAWTSLAYKSRLPTELRIKEGANARMGSATLVTGAKVVATTAVTASSRILITVQSLGTVTAPKAVSVTARTAGQDFTITSSDATDTSVVAWLIVEPA